MVGSGGGETVAIGGAGNGPMIGRAASGPVPSGAFGPGVIATFGVAGNWRRARLEKPSQTPKRIAMRRGTLRKMQDSMGAQKRVNREIA